MKDISELGQALSKEEPRVQASLYIERDHWATITELAEEYHVSASKMVRGIFTIVMPDLRKHIKAALMKDTALARNKPGRPRKKVEKN